MKSTQSKIEINTCCTECGLTANILTCLKKYEAIPKQLSFTTSTFHMGICQYCKEEKMVTEARDFFYPDFDLIDKVIELLK